MQDLAWTDDALVQCVDWALYHPDEMAVVTALRRAHGESRALIDTPGHVFAATEREMLVGFWALITNYGWSSYLYLPDFTTFFGWEGDLLDTWTTHEVQMQTIQETLRSHGCLAVD